MKGYCYILAPLRADSNATLVALSCGRGVDEREFYFFCPHRAGMVLQRLPLLHALTPLLLAALD